MKCNFFFLLLLFSLNIAAQNVGVGTTNPGEKLDVNGNINVTGTIKANGVDGTANQVLMKNGSGILGWGDLCDYKNVATFTSTGTSTWTVPDGVTRILAEAWGGGGGGSAFSGGGGGGYVAGTFSVTPGDVITLIIGAGGTAGTSTVNGGAGDPTAVSVGPNGINASGGFGGPANISMNAVPGGTGGAAGLFRNYISIRGESGKPGLNTFTTHGSNVYEIMNGGDGGDAGNSVATGGKGAYRMILTGGLTTLMRYKAPDIGRNPGGGGGSGWSLVSNTSSQGGSQGGYGGVVIHY
jgi:hypothetical protein